MTIKEKLITAEKETGQVLDFWSEAYKELHGNVQTNGYGILADSSLLKGKLLRAKKQIDNAIKILDQADWPTQADYDEFD